MDFKTLLEKRRTVRFFVEKSVPDELLAQLVNAGRLASCACNWQRLRYRVIRTPELVKAVFAHTGWGGSVTPRRTPQWGKNAPQAFIALTVELDGKPAAHLEADAGAAVMSMEFAATELGLGSCWLGSFDKEKVAGIIGAEEIIYLLAVGYPAETPVAEDVPADAKRSYYLDGNDLLHVPKISMADVAIWQ